MRGRKPKPDYANIARLERELHLDDDVFNMVEDIDAELEAERPALKEFFKPPILTATPRPVLGPMAVAKSSYSPYSPSDFELRPGVAWQVDDHSYVQIQRNAFEFRRSLEADLLFGVPGLNA